MKELYLNNVISNSSEGCHMKDTFKWGRAKYEVQMFHGEGEQYI